MSAWITKRTARQGVDLFDLVQPLENSATTIDIVPRNAADAGDRQLLAKDLHAEYLSHAISGNGDMITFWPNDTHYTHLIVCNELRGHRR